MLEKDSLKSEGVDGLELKSVWCRFVKMLVTMQDAICYFNNWESCYQTDVDNFFDTKTNTDFEAPPHILNSGRVSPG